MDHVALLDRRDTKFVLSARSLLAVLPRLLPHYRVLEVEGVRLHPYRTVYFDSPGFDLFRAHHNGIPRRHKVRARQYISSGLAFLEVKTKDPADRTVKSRIPSPGFVTCLRQSEREFVDASLPGRLDLAPVLANHFSRMTLVSDTRPERLTLDFDLAYAACGVVVPVPGVAIAEVKEPGGCRDSVFVREMRAAAARSASFSKYCVGVSLLYPAVKHNRFKPGLRLIHSISQEAAA